MAEKDKKYFWLRLKRDFFKRHDIQIIEAMPNGKDYILFYLKLLCESVDHEGNLRFSDEIPYNETMLSTITNTNVDIVRSAIKIFTELGMMELLDDGTYFMSEVQKMMGSETYWAEKKRIYRSKERQLEDIERTMSNEVGQFPTCPSKSKNKSKSIDIDIEKEKEEKKPLKRFAPPSFAEVKAYCEERRNGIDAEAFIDFYSSKDWMIGKNKMKDWKASVRTWEKRDRKPQPQKASDDKLKALEQYYLED